MALVESRDPSVPQDLKEKPGPQVPKDLPDPAGNKGLLALLVLKEKLGLQDRSDPLGRLESEAPLAPTAPKDCRDLRDPQAPEDFKD